MKTISDLNTHWWWRIFNVLFTIYYIGFVLVVIGCIISVFFYKYSLNDVFEFLLGVIVFGFLGWIIRGILYYIILGRFFPEK